MDKFGRDHGDDEYSVAGDKQEFSFIDFEDDDSVCNYQSNEDEPVVISNPFPFVRGKPQSVFVGETFSYPITLENTTRESVPLWVVKIFCSNPDDSFTLSLLKPPSVDSDANYIQRFLKGFSLDDRTLQPQRPLTIWLTCKPKEIGLHTSIVELDVGDDRIERVVFLLAEDKVSQSLSSRKPYSRTPRRGQELHLEKEMRNYDTVNARIKIRRDRLLALELPGLAERRPALVHGDIVFARLTFEDPNHSTPTHQGYIYRIEADEVILKFREYFQVQHHPRNLYDIQFSCNRINMRRLYQAVQAAEGLDLNLLFPSEVIERSNKGTPLVPFASLNQKQLLAVEMILGCKGAPPFVIHGPPGTGKTMTVVEAILQLYTKRKNACILVCAASNSAADHILQKIVSNSERNRKNNLCSHSKR
ncbi:putative rna helicase sde3 [Nicotiana attenuata]|uniref:Rna helicase sde3 n=1 Tax=Nicotiana attenuata TaxID=49451 RepID=A0A314LEP6_NICAT|nr:putative rna helicase sde3 [Nicotiana attenuata]